MTFSVCRATDGHVSGPDSKPRDGEPRGEVLKFTFENSGNFSGTTRDYRVYVPAPDTADKPACVPVNQVGVQFHAPVKPRVVKETGRLLRAGLRTSVVCPLTR